jgi:virginiamycin B lyase
MWFTAGYVIGRLTTSGEFSYYPSQATPQGPIAAGPDGALWFTASNASVGSIGRIATAGDVTLFPTPTIGSFPQGITAGPDGAIWFTESGANNIGRVTTTGQFIEYAIPTPNSYPLGIAAGPDAALWFTESLGNKIGRITTDGTITEYPIGADMASPNWITKGPDDALWFTELSLPGARIGRMLATGEVTSFVLSPEGTTGQIAAGPDGALWFTGGVFNSVSRITTSGVVTEYPLTTPSSFPTGITSGPDGAIWLVENNAGNVARATACGIGTSLSYTYSTLTVSFDVSITTPATWQAWVVTGSGVHRLFSRSIKTIVPPHPVTLTLPNFSSQGNVGVSSLLKTSSGGVLCSDLKTVDTGGSGPSVDELRRTAEKAGN